MRFGLDNKQFELLQNLLVGPLEKIGARVYVFGSRARLSHQDFSDIDILFELPEKTFLPEGFISEIKENLEESNLTIKVDLVNSKDLAESYRESVELDKVSFS